MIILFKNDTDYFNYMIDCDGKMCNEDVKNFLLKRLCGIHRSVKLNKVVDMPFKSIWYNKYLKYDLLNEDMRHIFIFFEGNQIVYDKKYINFLRKKYKNSVLVYRYTNIIDSKNSWTVEYVDKMFDLVITIDRKESYRKNWMWFPNTYNLKLATLERDEDIIYDIFFVGRDKGRHKKLLKLYNSLSNNGIRCLFLISGVSEKRRIRGLKGVQYIDLIGYKDVIRYIMKSKCILEIVQENQYGSSLRPMESIAFGKKLLTNDSEIVKCIYYDEKFMRVIDNYTFTDYEFLKDNSKINYRDPNLISSTRMFEMVADYFNIDISEDMKDFI